MSTTDELLHNAHGDAVIHTAAEAEPLYPDGWDSPRPSIRIAPHPAGAVA